MAAELDEPAPFEVVDIGAGPPTLWLVVHIHELPIVRVTASTPDEVRRIQEYALLPSTRRAISSSSRRELATDEPVATVTTVPDPSHRHTAAQYSSGLADRSCAQLGA
jgi:hypothetical protein